MRRRRTLSAEERRLWSHVARDVVPLRGRAADLEAETDLPPLPASTPSIHPEASAPSPLKSSKPALPPLAPLERRARSRLSRGVTSIDDVLDLHGLTQSEAHGRLVHFLHRAQAKGCAIVLVVTGKGGAGAREAPPFEERGVLKRSVPHWLRLPDLRPLVLGFEDAARHHGGSGALYVRLRRRRGPA
jgi:DNA-nicking Smr family endonuclease